MKRNAILIIGLVLCGVAVADLTSNLALVETYVEQQGFTWQQIKDATPRQWITHFIAADVDPNELSRTKRTLKRMVIKRKKQIVLENQVKALLAYIRNAGPDIETMPLIRELLENGQEVYGVDPNAFN